MLPKSQFPALTPTLALLAFCLAVAGGCARRETAADAGIRDGTLLVGNAAEPADLDPDVITSFTDSNIDYALLEGLTSIDEKTALPVPAAASSWEASSDGLIYTFHLRLGMLWSDGEPVTAGDFAYSFRRILTPIFGAKYSYMLWPIRNARAFNEGQLADFSQVGISAPDPLTLRLVLERPTPYLPALAAHTSWLPVNPRTIARFGGMTDRGSAWTRPGNFVGNGPFVLSEWVPNARIVAVKNPRYWDAAHVRLNRIVFYPVESFDTEEHDFRAGQMHVTYSLPVSKIAGYRGMDPPRLRVDPWLSTTYLTINVTKPPLDRLLVRRALALGIDREAITRDVLSGTAIPTRSLTPPGCAGYTPKAEVSDDFEQARRLLAQAGYPGGAGLPVIEIQAFSEGSTTRVLEAIQSMWRRELGVRVTITPLEQKTLYENQQSLNYQIGTAGWVADYPDPSTFLNQYVTEGGNNWAGWSDREFDRLVAESERTADNGRRYELFQRAEAILLGQAPIIPLYLLPRIYLIHPAVRGWDPSVLGFHNFKKVWLDPSWAAGR